MQLPLICITDGFAYYHPFNTCIKKSIKSVGYGSLQQLCPALSLPPAHRGAPAVAPRPHRCPFTSPGRGSPRQGCRAAPLTTSPRYPQPWGRTPVGPVKPPHASTLGHSVEAPCSIALGPPLQPLNSPRVTSLPTKRCQNPPCSIDAGLLFQRKRFSPIPASLNPFWVIHPFEDAVWGSLPGKPQQT